MSKTVNTVCPWTGEKVSEEEAAQYEINGVTLGFSSAKLRNHFAKAVEAFDAEIGKTSASELKRESVCLDENRIAWNKKCPFSGKPVAEDSLTKYGSYTVGFCNPDCRDSFARVMTVLESNSALIGLENNERPIFSTSAHHNLRQDHINFLMPKGEKAEHVCRQFYTGILGFVEVEKPPLLYSKFGGLWFDLPNTSVQIHLSIHDPYRWGREDMGHIAYEVTDIAAIEESLRRHNVAVEVPTQGDVPGVTRRFFIRDPFENIIEFLERERSRL
mmetsp:Transcript_8073/g.9264  ORF Transcript_8073/g.9264 Transcript_8073/m.9264 type:complete len:273 (-) Transcript_8073:1067-1885(-)|eukprot:CAMPEP_0184012398 /NCGR_PEP_ID=MMETSP0954-20121128/4387_1 /TAXON_ID=627963 /ORGANISM="Aplanochytrium sp, Strain PBS07" /LENGTH=272 /DNA_ID=CAMNT_0026292375 /DNA_START=186 /DNA_END=1004 /DNA_ORIENTATION=+